ncbi:MAG: Gfo/Idh/MocA family oxidoreductase [Dehalococcoidia bacterium]|nr:Gfo/Idh/MocA family oxidoreductase [Dehalococcoidia bacterium]
MIVPPPLRFGVLGLGRAGVSMLPALRTHPHAVVAAAADLNPTARAQFTRDFEVPAYDSAEALCASPEVGVVYIATPHQFHAEHCLLAAANGKHIVVEKPLALTLADCDTIIDAVERAGVTLIVGHTASYNPTVGAARAIIRTGELGRLRLINFAAYTPFLYRPRRPEELDSASGGGILFNQTPHQVDASRLLGGGMLKSVRATAGVWDPGRRTEGACAALLQFDDGAAASLVYSGYDHFDSLEFRVSTEDERSLSLTSHGATRRALNEGARSPDEETAMLSAMGYGGPAMRSVGPGGMGMFQVELGLAIVSCERGDLRLVADGLIIYDDEGRRSLPLRYDRGVPGRGNVFDELRSAVVDGIRPIHDARWGKATLEACLAIQQSSKEDREVYLSHQVTVGD